MRPIRKGDRGAAVEDVQRRLIALGADLGRTGVDGVFLGATYAAVLTFQRERLLDEDGVVGPQTWAALVDATFTLGDRLLYLRFPYLHGEDIRELQSALNALGFACGAADSIFGAFTERAVRDFQKNTGLASDGIVGPDTVRAVEGLRHVWSVKSQPPPEELRASASRSAAVLADVEIVLACSGATGALAERLANLAQASEPGARVRRGPTQEHSAGALVIELTDSAVASAPMVSAQDGGAALSRRLAAAIVSVASSPERLVVVLVEEPVREEHALQALAVSLLDGLCSGLADPARTVLP